MKELVSVVMSTYNNQDTIVEAIQSVLNQSYKNLELIIINDASTDDTLKKINKVKNNKIILLNNKTNLGLTKSLNKGIKISRGKYIARIDADDLWLPEKLNKQLPLMKKFDIVGTSVIELNMVTKKKTNIIMESNPVKIKRKLYKKCPFAHSTVLINKKKLIDCGSYDSTFRYAQDYELWIRMLQKNSGTNLREALCIRRTMNDSIGHKKWKDQEKCIINIMKKHLNSKNLPKKVKYEIFKRKLSLLIPSKFKELKYSFIKFISKFG